MGSIPGESWGCGGVIAHQTRGQLWLTRHLVEERVPRSPRQSVVARVVPRFVQHLKAEVMGNGS